MNPQNSLNVRKMFILIIIPISPALPDVSGDNDIPVDPVECVARG